MISVRALSARAGAFLLRAVDLSVAPGAFLVLLGPSGAGKTLLLEAMLGLRKIDSGRVWIRERDVTDLPPEERHLAYMPQDVALFPHLSVRENILFGRRVRGTMAGAEADLERLADSLHLRHLIDRPRVGSLSGGERQRVALARALITHPDVLFLDESFSALDAHLRRQLLLQLRALQRDLGITVVYVTHHQEEASEVGDQVAVLMEGNVVQVAPPGHLFRHPADLRVARFLQLSNLFPVDAVEGATCTIRGVSLRLDAPPEGLAHEAVHGPHPPAPCPSPVGRGSQRQNSLDFRFVSPLSSPLRERRRGAGGEDSVPPHGQGPPENLRGRLWLSVAAEDVLALRPGEAALLGIAFNRFSGRILRVDTSHRRPRAEVAIGSSDDLVLCWEIPARDRFAPGAGVCAGDEVELHLPPRALALFPEEAPRSAP